MVCLVGEERAARRSEAYSVFYGVSSVSSGAIASTRALFFFERAEEEHICARGGRVPPPPVVVVV